MDSDLASECLKAFNRFFRKVDGVETDRVVGVCVQAADGAGVLMALTQEPMLRERMAINNPGEGLPTRVSS